MSVTMRQMLEAGVHFGHQTRFWNPRMAPYIFGQRNKIHIVNLEKTMAKYNEAMEFVRKLAANRGNIMFVSTKRQAREIIAEEAQRAGMPYVEERWLGGMLTNFKTVKQSIKRIKEGEAMMEDGSIERLSKREALTVRRELAHELDGFVVLRHRLLEVDDVDLVALAEDVGGHARVPETGLVTEVDAGFQHLTHRDGHVLLQTVPGLNLRPADGRPENRTDPLPTGIRATPPGRCRDAGGRASPRKDPVPQGVRILPAPADKPTMLSRRPHRAQG